MCKCQCANVSLFRLRMCHLLYYTQVDSHSPTISFIHSVFKTHKVEHQIKMSYTQGGAILNTKIKREKEMYVINLLLLLF